MKYFKIALFYAFFGAFLVNSSFAKQNDDKAELEALKRRISVLEQKIVQKDSKIATEDVKISLNPIPSFTSFDGSKSFILDGRLQVDAGFLPKGKTSGVDNAMSIRRMWLGAKGKIDDDWHYRVLFDLDNNNPSTIVDAFVSYRGIKNAPILIGNFFENNGIDNETSSLVSSFMERSSGVFTFRQLRRTGVSIDPYGKNWGMELGVFGAAPNNARNANAKGHGISTRAYFLPIKNDDKNHFLHFGWNGSYRTPDSATKTMRFHSNGNSLVINQTLIDTGSITNVDDYYQNAAELRYQNDGFTLTSEFIQTVVNRTTLSDLHFKGGYIQASYFLTNDRYGYDVQKGVQNRGNISNKAWEIAMRYSLTDLNSKTVQGGRMDSYDFGVNYHLNQNIKFMANYILNRLDRNAQIQKNPQHLMFRTQVSF